MSHLQRSSRISQCPRVPQRMRSGLSLMETMMAAAVLLGSVVALSQLASIGRKHAERAASITTAQVLCQNKMSEIASGLAEAFPQSDVAFISDPNWAYSVNVAETAWESVMAVEVSVRPVSETEAGGLGSAAAAAASGSAQTSGGGRTTPRPPTFRLVRWFPIDSASLATERDDFEEDDSDTGGGF